MQQTARVQVCALLLYCKASKASKAVSKARTCAPAHLSALLRGRTPIRALLLYCFTALLFYFFTALLLYCTHLCASPRDREAVLLYCFPAFIALLLYCTHLDAPPRDREAVLLDSGPTAHKVAYPSIPPHDSRRHHPLQQHTN